ncbi:MAG: HAMP domain-containing histidine kinase [Lentisphaeria bacterium]|nr:HAMP domain-containing histidine kinase [Lentisphaeria bacterium]
MSLVKAIVKAHKWQITLHSIPGEGSTFTVIIPVKEPIPRKNA